MSSGCWFSLSEVCLPPFSPWPGGQASRVGFLPGTVASRGGLRGHGQTPSMSLVLAAESGRCPVSRALHRWWQTFTRLHLTRQTGWKQAGEEPSTAGHQGEFSLILDRTCLCLKRGCGALSLQTGSLFS